MINEKFMAHLRTQQEAEDSLLDYDEVGGLFSEIQGCSPSFSEDGVSHSEKKRLDPKTTAEQQLLFTQIFEFLTEDHVDPMLGLFHFRTHRRDVIH